MKIKRIVTLALAAAMASTAALSASAATLTNENPGGQTEVTAYINSDPGNVSYIITIPDLIDFGLLTPPEPGTPDVKEKQYSVIATNISGLDVDKQKVSVYVKDQKASLNGDQQFYIANKNDDTKKFEYKVYAKTTDVRSLSDATMTDIRGYYLTSFFQTNDSITGKITLDQDLLNAYPISEIAGVYSGYMVFFSSVEPK